MCDRAARAEANLAALREAAQAVVKAFDEYPSVAEQHLTPLRSLRAVLASADSESREETP